MGKRGFSILLAFALVASVFTVLPARAQEAPPTPTTVPEVVNVEDPKGDANYLNDQGGACVGAPLPPTCTPYAGDNVGSDAVGTVSDILKVWFTSDATNVNAHILTNAAPPASTPLFFRVRVDPGEGSNCLWFQAFFAGVTQGQTEPTNPTGASLRDTCTTALGTQTEGIKLFVETSDDDGITTIQVPKTLHPAFADGGILKTPDAHVRNFIAGTVTAPQVDNTKPGTDFTITSGGPVVKPAPEKPGKNDPPGKGKKKGCSKGKGKKKGACPGKKTKKPKKPKTPVTPACPAYVAGDEGAEAETTIVTDAATEEAPVVVELTAGAGLANDLGLAGGAYDETSSIFQNVQVDTANPEAGLYARLEFQEFHDYDLYLNYPDGSTAANSGDFNIAPGHDLGGGSPDGAWEAGTNYESVLGIATDDCGGYTARMVSYLTNGGAVTLSLWLGEVTAEPAAPGGGQESAFDAFWSRLGL